MSVDHPPPPSQKSRFGFYPSTNPERYMPKWTVPVAAMAMDDGWKIGTPRPEFLHCDDLAHVCLVLVDRYSDRVPINVGGGEDISIKESAELIAEATSFAGKIERDTSGPDGKPRKLLDVGRLRELGWGASRSVDRLPGFARRVASPAPLSTGPRL